MRFGLPAIASGALTALVACATPEAGGRSVTAVGASSATDPGTGTTIVRGVPTLPPAASDGPGTFSLHAAPPNAIPSPVSGAENAVAAVALAGGAVAFVTRAGDLIVGRVIDRGVQPELAVSLDGEQIAYVRRAGTGMELVVATSLLARQPVLRVVAHEHAGDLVFRDDGRALAFDGTNEGGLAAMFVVGLDRDGEPPVPLTNRGLVSGQGRPPGFVPPPVGAEGLSLTRTTLRYRGPDAWYEVGLPGGETRRIAVQP